MPRFAYQGIVQLRLSAPRRDVQELVCLVSSHWSSRRADKCSLRPGEGKIYRRLQDVAKVPLESSGEPSFNPGCFFTRRHPQDYSTATPKPDCPFNGKRPTRNPPPPPF